MEEKRFIKAVVIVHIVVSITTAAAIFFTNTIAVEAYVLVNMATIILSDTLVTNGSIYENAWLFYTGGCVLLTLALLSQNYRLDNIQDIPSIVILAIITLFVLSAIFYILAAEKQKKQEKEQK